MASTPTFPPNAAPIAMERPIPHERNEKAWMSAAGFCGIAAAILGLIGILPTILSLRQMWLTQPLKSVGMIVPFVSAAIILSIWRRIGWTAQGSWWGLALIVAAFISTRMQELMFVLNLRPWLQLMLMPTPVIVLLYVAGVVLLFGGAKLLRAAIFPVLFVCLVDPVPKFFSEIVDYRLQEISAAVARNFAILLGVPLSNENLRLMFTPSFGMFIAPGCNGIRGSVTLGLVALVAGYLMRFRLKVLAPFVAGAVLLGYLCNFLRLCTLVLYYMVALHFPSLQKHGTIADYIIGGCIFVCASFAFISVMLKLRGNSKYTNAPQPQEPFQRTRNVQLVPKLAAVAACAMFFGAGYVASAVASARQVTPDANAAFQAAMPKELGGFILSRTWLEGSESTPYYRWAEYITSGGDARVKIGSSRILGAQHNPIVCHRTRGEYPILVKTETLRTKAGPAVFTAALYQHDGFRTLEVDTMCSRSECGNDAIGEGEDHLRLRYRVTRDLLSPAPTRTIPVLIRLDSADMASDPAAVEQHLLTVAQTFLEQADLPRMSRQSPEGR